MSASDGIWVGMNGTHVWVSIRGTQSKQDVRTDAKLAAGQLAFTRRARACREVLVRTAALLSHEATRVTFTGHSLGGSLAIELHNNALCNDAFNRLDLRAIVFNPGWLAPVRHYQLASANFINRVTIHRTINDVVSAAISRSIFKDRIFRHAASTEWISPRATHSIAAFIATNAITEHTGLIRTDFEDLQAREVT